MNLLYTHLNRGVKSVTIAVEFAILYRSPTIYLYPKMVK
jgi:hypothetical protein